MSKSSSDKAKLVPESHRKPGAALVQAGIKPIAPGAYLRKYVLPSKELELDEAASMIGVSDDVLDELLTTKRRVDEKIAIKLAKFTHRSKGFWLNMQAAFDLSQQLARNNADEPKKG